VAKGIGEECRAEAECNADFIGYGCCPELFGVPNLKRKAGRHELHEFSTNLGDDFQPWMNPGRLTPPPTMMAAKERKERRDRKVHVPDDWPRAESPVHHLAHWRASTGVFRPSRPSRRRKQSASFVSTKPALKLIMNSDEKT